ncbi:MAG: hypothetical protein AAF705_14145 [Bacteroidota bacterium]
MKKQPLLFVCFLLFTAYSLKAQLAFQFADVDRNGTSLSNIPRFSWMIPLSYEIAEISQSFGFNGGVLLKNDGVIFDENGDRFKFRVISIGPEIGFFTNLGQSKLILSGDYGFDFALHYKEKVFPNGERSDKIRRNREWFSERPNRLNHYFRIGVGTENGLFMFGQFYLREFLNTGFQETIDGVTVQPYEGLVIQRFHLGISFRFSKDTSFKFDWTQ